MPGHPVTELIPLQRLLGLELLPVQEVVGFLVLDDVFYFDLANMFVLEILDDFVLDVKSFFLLQQLLDQLLHDNF